MNTNLSERSFRCVNDISLELLIWDFARWKPNGQELVQFSILAIEIRIYEIFNIQTLPTTRPASRKPLALKNVSLLFLQPIV